MTRFWRGPSRGLGGVPYAATDPATIGRNHTQKSEVGAIVNTAVNPSSARQIGTEESPLIHPVTGERIVFRKRARDTDGEFMEMSLYLAPGGFIARPHVHPNQEERFEVSGAAVMFKIEGKERLYQPGEVAVVPPGTAHVWWNPSAEEATTLVQFRPALDTETFFETFFGLAAEGKVGRSGMPNALQTAVLARDFRHEMALPTPAQWVFGPLTVLLAPVGRAIGYRGRYEKYSGPESAG
jgi:quercetin dioxygenase-like cupin family protein